MRTKQVTKDNNPRGQDDLCKITVQVCGVQTSYQGHGKKKCTKDKIRVQGKVIVKFLIYLTLLALDRERLVDVKESWPDRLISLMLMTFDRKRLVGVPWKSAKKKDAPKM